ncbi:MAG TPA: 16S rRNA (adenine(1518)-N(6)/adenine(1519)-N(6))-dimethyltransferase RsmA [Acidobacteriota bacterium]|nr:16S rRNA (adenine(1518)-N(6)/adenine(1519)-N(6))-dimethyltransferase RsmA [Acidobacteriota bacterium]
MYKSRRHALGQHFLTNDGVLRKIIGAIDPRPDDVIVEIGAGKGALTAGLAERAGRVIALEKDERLVPELKESVPANVEVVRADILKVDLREIFEKSGVPSLRLVGNIPYSISSPLLFRVLDERALFSDCVFLVQKEVAARVTAGPGTKSYAPLGILIQNEFEAKIAFLVSPGSFSPPPKVQSALLTLRRRPAPLRPEAAEEPYRSFLRAAFAERRKMLWKNLARRATPAALERAYAEIGIARNARAEELAPEILYALFQALRPKSPART